MFYYFLMCVSITFTTLNGTLLHKFSNRGLKNTGDIYLFNGALNLVWSAILLILACITGGIRFDVTTLLFGSVYAVILCAYQLFKCLSLASGPISLTTLIANCAFLITTAYAFFIDKEPVSPVQLIGIILLLGALLLCINPNSGKSDSNMKITLRWFIFAMCLFFAGGGVGIIYRIFGKSEISQNATSMLFFAAIISSAIFFLLAHITNGITKNPRPQLSKTPLTYALICGITGCIYIRMNLSLSAVIPSVIFFPVSNGATVILSSVVGWLFFREKLKSAQIAGICLGMIAIVCIGCF